jgi:hypothetical protein
VRAAFREVGVAFALYLAIVLPVHLVLTLVEGPAYGFWPASVAEIGPQAREWCVVVLPALVPGGLIAAPFVRLFAGARPRRFAWIAVVILAVAHLPFSGYVLPAYPVAFIASAALYGAVMASALRSAPHARERSG